MDNLIAYRPRSCTRSISKDPSITFLDAFHIIHKPDPNFHIKSGRASLHQITSSTTSIGGVIIAHLETRPFSQALCSVCMLGVPSSWLVERFPSELAEGCLLLITRIGCLPISPIVFVHPTWVSLVNPRTCS